MKKGRPIYRPKKYTASHLSPSQPQQRKSRILCRRDCEEPHADLSSTPVNQNIESIQMKLSGKFGSILKHSVVNNAPMFNPVRSMSALKKLIGGKMSAKTAGRNSQGRITSFHRGGGAKRLHRIIDLKRADSAMGVFERVEYDPYHSSHLALVRWVEGMKQPRPRKTKPQKSAQSSMDVNPLTLPSSAWKVGSSELMDPYVVVGLPNKRVPWSKNNFTNQGTGSIEARVRDILFSTLTPRNTKGETPFRFLH